MRNYVVFILLTLAGCGGDIKSSLGLKKSGPDEFSVIANQPLTVPPSFQLTNPKKNHNITKIIGEDEQEEITRKGEIIETEEDVMFLKNLSSKSKQQLPDANDHTYEEKKGFFRRISSKLSGIKKEKVIDPKLEKNRIQNNLKENKPINQGEVHEKDISTSPLQSILEGK